MLAVRGFVQVGNVPLSSRHVLMFTVRVILHSAVTVLLSGEFRPKKCIALRLFLPPLVHSHVANAMSGQDGYDES